MFLTSLISNFGFYWLFECHQNLFNSENVKHIYYKYFKINEKFSSYKSILLNVKFAFMRFAHVRSFMNLELVK